MRAAGLAEDFPVVDLDSAALAAVELLARQRLPGLVVTERDGRPRSILAASQVVRFLVPGYVQDDPVLARVITESMADRVAGALGGKKVRDLLPRHAPELAVVDADHTMLEVAAVMARLRCPLAAVLNGGTLVGVITATRLLEAVLAVDAER